MDDGYHNEITSGEGIAAFVLSPDESNILLVYERDMWKLVTGTVEVGEDPLDTLESELMEEVGISIDESYPVELLAIRHHRAARHGYNDTCFVYLCKSSTWDITPDMDEIYEAEWFPIQYIHKLKGLSKEVLFYIDNYNNNRTLEPIEYDGVIYYL